MSFSKADYHEIPAFTRNDPPPLAIGPWVTAKKGGKVAGIGLAGIVVGVALSVFALFFIMPQYLQTTPLSSAARALMIDPKLSKGIGVLMLSQGSFFFIVSAYYLRDGLWKTWKKRFVEEK